MTKRSANKGSRTRTRNNPPMPNASSWRPRDASAILSTVLGTECGGAEARLLQALEHETKFSINNYDAGLPFEALVRDELATLLPTRYSLTTAHAVDRHGRTAGNCDVIVFNNTWFSPVKSPATKSAGMCFLPIDGIYAIGEVKKTLSASTLDAAMEKLVKGHRLERPQTYARRIVENRDGAACPHGTTNPLYTFIMAGGLADGESFTDLVSRFFEISKQLGRMEIVRAVCVLGEGTVTWSFRHPLHGKRTPTSDVC